MQRKKLNREDKVIQTFETTKPLKLRLESAAQEKNITVSALIRNILESYFEDRQP